MTEDAAHLLVMLAKEILNGSNPDEAVALARIAMRRFGDSRETLTGQQAEPAQTEKAGEVPGYG